MGLAVDKPSAGGVNVCVGRYLDFLGMFDIGDLHIIQDFIQVGLALAKTKSCSESIGVKRKGYASFVLKKDLLLGIYFSLPECDTA
jgi:hypothetical protein